MRSRKRKKGRFKALKAAGIVLLVLVLLFTSLQLYVILYPINDIYYSISELEGIEKPKAVLVLGAGVFASGAPSPVLKDRLDYAYEVYEY